MDKHIHPALARQIVNPVSHVLEICVRRCDNVNDTTDFRLRDRMVMPVIMSMAMMVMIVRVRRLPIIEPKARNSVANDAAELA